jgi:hypothetical protein
VLAKFPQFQGQLRYVTSRALRRRPRIIEYKAASAGRAPGEAPVRRRDAVE